MLSFPTDVHRKLSLRATNVYDDYLAFYIILQVGWLYMMTRLIVNISQVYLAYFVTETLKLSKVSSILMLLFKRLTFPGE